jgi:hypothetical protein
MGPKLVRKQVAKIHVIKTARLSLRTRRLSVTRGQRSALHQPPLNHGLYFTNYGLLFFIYTGALDFPFFHICPSHLLL